ncbi:MAG: HD domain-containing protein [Proteobacteria bacterium]|nr:HD domain-containing protein [Pseudomonadota bacterium]
MRKKYDSELQSGIVALLRKKDKVQAQSLSREDKRLARLIDTVINEVNVYADYQINHIKKLTDVGLALSGEKNINKLLEMIVDAARDLTCADAGTLYTVDSENQCLRFEILQNDTMKTYLGGTSGVEVTLPPVPLYLEGKANHSNVSSCVALTEKTVNIPDVYEAEGFDFSGTKKYDSGTGYRSKSMLVIPLKNHENDIIGVLQLLNAKDIDSGEVIPFSDEYVDLIGSLASEAAVSLTNAQLIQDLKELFYAFIKSIAAAIDEKSPYTGGHIDRVVKLTMMIAQKINETTGGPFADVQLSDDEMEELKLATWMHDVGKITTPEYVIDKRTKLETIFDRMHLVETRFDLIANLIKNHYLEEKIQVMKNGKDDTDKIKALDARREKELKEVREEKEFLAVSNTPKEFMDDDKLKKLNDIASKTYEIDGETFPYLTEEELKNLSIRKGSLTDEERQVIENHVYMTKVMLEQLPFPKNLSNVPAYASGHHETLDGTGYPSGLNAGELSLQARIMAVADVFEALTAKDRPYKKPMKLSQAVNILGFMKKDKHIDGDIFDLFINSNLFMEYAESELRPEQIDDVELKTKEM